LSFLTIRLRAGRPLPQIIEVRIRVTTATRGRELHVHHSDRYGARTVRYDEPVDFTAAITHEDPWYVARCLDVEVASQGETAEEALANLKEALELYFEDEVLPEGLEPPIIATLRLSA